ncbi:MAG TPA: DUF4405 domain-containing protein, partial [Desulfosporosinus sp.]|nr:DUF4405 domain-containing protein [Desulfosporosinus sp.]
LYNSHAISLAFHEIAGLFLFGLFIIHCLLNRKWVTSITAKFFSKSIAPRVRFGYIIDLMLLVSFVLIIISGISTSQVLFPSIAQVKDSPWRSVHHFLAAFSIILVGIHLGLHWNFVIGMFKKAIQIPQKLAKPLGIGLLLIIVVFGSYSIVTSGFASWLAEPFLSANESAAPNDSTDTTKNEDKSLWDGTINGDKPGEGSTATEESKTGTVVKEEAGNTNGNTGKNGENKGGNTSVHPVGEKKSEEGSPIAIAGTVATYLSILGVFTALTYYIDKFLKKKKRSRKAVRELKRIDNYCSI